MVSQSSSLVLLLSWLFLQSSAPTQTASSDENSDTSTTPPTHKHVRTRGGTVKQATGRRIQTREGGRGATANSIHGRGVGAGRRPGHGGSRASWDSLVGLKRRFTFTSTLGVNILPEDSTNPLSILKMFLSDELITVLSILQIVKLKWWWVILTFKHKWIPTKDHYSAFEKKQTEMKYGYTFASVC